MVEVNPTQVVMGQAVPGAVEAGPASIGGMSVISRTELPGEFNVAGSRYSVLQKNLQPGEEFQGESGVMMYMSDDVKMEARFGGWRMFSGEGLAKVNFKNHGSTPGVVGLTPNLPMSVVIPYETSQGPLNCKRGAFMAGDKNIRVHPKILPASSALACCCGGMPPIIQEIKSGPEGHGLALLNAGGTLVTKNLEPGESIIVDTNAVVAFTAGVGYDVRTVGNFMTCCFGGEGCFNTEMKGPGTVYLQTVSYEGLMKSLVKTTGGGGGEGGGGGGAPPEAEEIER